MALQWGSYLLAYDCDDAILNEPVVDREWSPSAGRIEIEIGVVEDAKAWTATVRTVGLVVEEATAPGSSCVVPDTSWTDMGFGWLAG